VSDKKFECEVMGWKLFEELAMKVANEIISSNFHPDFIIGLARGGWVLSRMLCDYLGIKDLISLKVEHWGITATPDGEAHIKYPFNFDLSGKKVLLVDDITDTGESLKIAYEYVNSLNPKEIKTATLRHIKGSKFLPDYYGDKIKWRWVIFPWNYTEDICNILPKADEEQDPQEIRKWLKIRHNIELDIPEIIRIRKEASRRSRLLN
jgi:hypoxanthine phosphoribosyltransferase